jgi:hypothetical protein
MPEDDRLLDWPDTQRILSVLIERFVRTPIRDRCLVLIASQRGYRKFIDGLAHFSAFEPSLCRRLPPTIGTPEALTLQLGQEGAPAKCVVFSEAQDIDRHELPLAAAIQRAFGSGSGTLVSCIPGILAYYEGEEPGDRWILTHQGTRQVSRAGRR